MRICTFNVHHWADARGRSNTERVMDLLRALDCDLVVLNEVTTRGGQVERVADALELHCARAPAGFLANALLSRAPLARVETVALAEAGEARSALLAEVRTPTGALTACATHLDPADEDLRLEQLASLHDALARRAAPVHFVAGDFNALRLADYSPAALARVTQHRAASQREAPRGEVVAQMDAWGYVDAFRRARGTDPVAPLPEAALPTCWAGTRIDYIWLSPALAATARITRCDVIATDASDHHPVLLEFEQPR